jgi:uncharacterized membrane protein
MTGLAIGWTHAGTSALAAFLASLVEFTEAMTVVLAVGAVRGWRGAVIGSIAGLAALLVLVAVLGPALTRIPLGLVQVAVGGLLLLFGLRWLRKAALRSAGVIALRDETEIYATQTATLRAHGVAAGGWDRVAVSTSFKIVLLEGVEVVFIVVAVGAGGGLLLPASAGALAALVVVVLLGLALHRPVASIPENTLKFLVGVLLSAFGTFWLGEGIGAAWPGADWSLPALIVGYLAVAIGAVALARMQRGAAGGVAGKVGGRVGE